jgi:hypothetical protein
MSYNVGTKKKLNTVLTQFGCKRPAEAAEACHSRPIINIIQRKGLSNATWICNMSDPRAQPIDRIQIDPAIISFSSHRPFAPPDLLLLADPCVKAAMQCKPAAMTREPRKSQRGKRLRQ